LIRGPIAVAAEPERQFEELVLEVRINDQNMQEMLVVLRDADGGFWIDTSDLERLRLRLPATAPQEYQGQRHVPLAAFVGADVRFDAPLAMLYLQLPASAFLPSQISVPEQQVGTPQQAATGVFANYQFYGQRVAGITGAGAFTELGLFSRYGVATSTMATRYFDGSTRNTRLDTSFSRDYPERMQTLTLGDAISDPGSWGSALRFGGVRFEKNFATRPDLVTAPLLIAAGTAVVPSSVDVFVNNQRVLTEQVQPGPFVIDNLPTVTGAGDVRVVVRDAAGREQVLVQPFYSSPSLLATGLDQYSLSVGRVRENYALASFDYGPWAGSGTLRRGLNDSLTIEGHAEYLQGAAHGVGLEIVARAGNLGIASMKAAAGGGDSSRGWLGGVGFERQAQRASFSTSMSYASAGFRRAGESEFAGFRQKFRGVAQVGLNLGAVGSTTLAIARQTFQDNSRLQTVSLAHNLRVGAGFMYLSVNRSTGDRSATSAFLTYTQAWGPRRTLSTAAEGGSGFGATRDDLRAAISQSAPVGVGAGWRLGATQRGNYDAWWQQRFEAVDVELQAARNFSQSGQSALVRGGMSWLDGSAHAARSVDGSFAIVDVAGIPDVPVYLENHLVTRTDARGRAVLPNLLSYQSNRVSIEPEDLPLNTSIAARTVIIRPAWRSGVIARFPVERVSPAVFRLVLPDGSALPTGAEVRLNGGIFAVAMDGFTYVTTLDHGSAGTASWEKGRCVFRVDPPPADDPLPDMGTIICRTPTEAVQ
jgi:outer membrane usher protein